MSETDASVGQDGEDGDGGVFSGGCEGGHVLEYVDAGFGGGGVARSRSAGGGRRRRRRRRRRMLVVKALVECRGLVEGGGGGTCESGLFELDSKSKGTVGFSGGGGYAG